MQGVSEVRWQQLGQMLLERGVIDSDQLFEALNQQREQDGYLGEILLELGFVEQMHLYSLLAEQAGIPFVQLEPAYQDPAVAGTIPFGMIRKLRAIPLFRVENRVTVAMDDPTNLDRIKELAFATGGRVNAVYTTPETIDAAIDARTGNLVDVAGLSNTSSRDLKSDADTTMEEDFGWAMSTGAEDAAELSKSSVVIDLIDHLIVEALTVKASDIHLEPKARHLRVRFRLDGILTDRPSIPNGYKLAVLSRCKIMGAMDIAERRSPQDGAFSMKFKGRRVDFRVSSFPTKYGEVVVIRILDRSGLKLELETLGFPQDLATSIRETVSKPNGILLVTGPTGSGKTSTLYALLKEMDSATKKIITLEDPIEYDLPDICQGQTHTRAGFTFSTGLRSILRQDPDAIMVGEIRDVETAQIAIQASLTGHMVMSTLHTNSASAAISRLLDMGLEPFLMATSLSGLLAQRLVRRLCGNCKEPYEMEQAESESLALEFPSGNPTPTLFRAKGCMYCNSLGYRGRQGIFEYIEVDHNVQSMIIRRVSGKDLERELLETKQFRTLRNSGLELVEEGVTTLEEVLRVTT
ncbi:MAG: GspE/PulE family protein [Myxococcota bacterium]|nr:GspE/PulE family protein [Myxococcota bacterium]